MISNKTHPIIESALTWEWTKKLLYWLILSAGTMSECVFLLASLWMSINASVHPLVTSVMSEDTTRHISELSTAAYVALPELILGLAVVTVIARVRVYLYNKSDISALAWSILYGIPTLVFLLLSLITLGCSVMSVEFRMPEPLVVIRALAGYWYAFISLLYAQLGAPQEVDRLQQKDDRIGALYEESKINVASLCQEKDAMIAELRNHNELLTADLERQSGEIENLKSLLDESKNAHKELINAVNKSDDTALQAYSEECLIWLKSGVKTVFVEEITRYTGISKRRIEGAINKGLLQTAPRNKDLILMSSLTEWLKNTSPSMSKAPHVTPLLHVVNG